MKLWGYLALGVLSGVLSVGCDTRSAAQAGTFRVELRPVQVDAAAPILLCVPDTTVTPLSRALNPGNSILLVEHALVWSEGVGSTLSLESSQGRPPRLLSNGVPHPDDRLSVTLSIAEGTPGYSPPVEELQQTEHDKVVDIPGDEFDLYIERTASRLRERLRPPSGVWRTSRLAIECDTDPRLIEHFSGAGHCHFYFRSEDLLYSVTTGRGWLQHWPEVLSAVEQAIARYRNQCR